MSDEAQIEKDIMQLLRTEVKKRRVLQRSRSCPDKHLIAAYTDGGLTEDELSAVENHIASCAVCLEDVAVSARHANGPSLSETVPDRLQAHLEELGEAAPVWHSWVSWKTASAVAASIVLVVLFFVRSDPETVNLQPSPGHGTTQRSDSAFNLRPSITFPTEDAEVTREDLEFRWTDARAATYEIELVGDGGALIWSAKTREEVVVLPQSVALEAGRQYYISVIARGVGGRSVRSRFVGFRISKR